jgi:hypothetical protein
MQSHILFEGVFWWCGLASKMCRCVRYYFIVQRNNKQSIGLTIPTPTFINCLSFAACPSFTFAVKNITKGGRSKAKADALGSTLWSLGECSCCSLVVTDLQSAQSQCNWYWWLIDGEDGDSPVLSREWWVAVLPRSHLPKLVHHGRVDLVWCGENDELW